MAKRNRNATLDFILRWEGGYVKHPKDPGGATNRGVTQDTYDEWRKRKGKHCQPVYNIFEDEVHAIYGEYLDAVAFDALPDGLDMAMADTSIHSGPKRATTLLQAALNKFCIPEPLEVDGVLGPKTKARLAAAGKEYGLPRVVEAYIGDREMFLSRLKAYETFGKGWLNRTEALRVASRPLAERPAKEAPFFVGFFRNIREKLRRGS